MHLSSETAAALLAALVGIWFAVAIGASALAVAIVGPRRRSALIRPAVATLVCLPIMVLSFPSAPGWLSAVLGLVAVPFGVALVQRSGLAPAAGHVPRRWLVAGGLVVGGGVGAGVGFVASPVLGEAGGGLLFAAVGGVPGAVAGWRWA